MVTRFAIRCSVAVTERTRGAWCALRRSRHGGVIVGPPYLGRSFPVQLWRPHPAVSPKGIKILRPDDDDRLVELTRTEETLRATARQQEAVAHLGQQALAGAPVSELIDAAVALVARVLEVDFSCVLELRAPSRTLVLRAGVGWREGSVGRTVVPATPDTHAGYVLRSPGAVVVEDLAAETRFGSAPLLDVHGVVSGLSVIIHGKERPFGILGAHSARRRAFTSHDVHFLQAAASVLATAIDRATAEEALRRSEEHFRSLIENALDIVTVVGEDGTFQYASPSVERLLGYRPGELLQRNAFQFVHPDDLPVVAEALARAIKDPAAAQMEAYGIVFEASYTPIRDRDGSLAGVIGVGTDITERRKAEEALRRSEESSRALVQHATYGIYRSSPEGRFLAVNPALVKLLGYPSEDALLAVDMARDVYADPAERPQVIARFDHSDAVQGVDVTWKRWDGRKILVRLSGRAVRRRDGSIDCFETLAEDVTERRALEEQLRQSQKMEAIGQLTGGIAHDFNNLLTIILANAELIARALPTDRSDAQADLRAVISAALRGRVMVKELLGFARRTSLNLTAVDLSGVLADLSGMLRRILPADVEIVTAGDEGLPEVRADLHATEQILFNLVTNARDAMPNGGVLRIETRRVRLTDEQRTSGGATHGGDFVCLAVEDTGVGMDEQTRQRIFEPFFTTKPVGRGTGLGLATVYGLVQQHGGSVEVDSEPGKGTRVRVYFPTAEVAATRPRRHSAPHQAPGGSETILLVEDDDQLRRATKRVLEDAGYQVLTAADGQEALEVLRQQGEGIRLVLSDLVMPRLGGRALYDAARREGRAMPFLFASGYSDGDRSGRAPLDPSLPFLFTPWTPNDLLNKVRELLDAK